MSPSPLTTPLWYLLGDTFWYTVYPVETFFNSLFG